MKNPLKIAGLVLLGLLVLVPLGCLAGYQELRQDQKAEIAFTTLDFAFDTAEAMFILLERDGIQHMPTARAAYTIAKSAIETYLATLKTLGIIATPDYAVKAIERINDRALELGVVERERSSQP